MERNSWLLWGASGMNLGLGVVIGWLVTQWILVSPEHTPIDKQYIPKVKPLPPQIGRGIKEEQLQVPEPVELSRHKFEFNNDLPLIKSPEILSDKLFAEFAEFHLRNKVETPITPDITQKMPYENQAEPVQAQLVASLSILPDPAQTKTLIEQTTVDPDERQVWQETLHGMPLEAVEDILKFRRNYGMASRQEIINNPVKLPEITPQDSPLDMPFFYEPAVQELSSEKKVTGELNALPHWKKETIKHLDQELKCLEITSSIQAYNLANAKVPWFRRVNPRVVSNGLAGAEMKKSEVTPDLHFAADHGPQVVLEISHVEPKLLPSLDLWDIALTGNGLFQVQEDANVFYVRGGKLCLNQDQYLCIKVGEHDDYFVIEPAIILPENLALSDLEITPEGVVELKNEEHKEIFGNLTVAKITDYGCFDEPEPGIFIPKEQTETNNKVHEPVKLCTLKQDHSPGQVKLLFGKTASSTVNQQSELKQLEKTLSQIVKIRTLKQQIMNY